MKEEANNKDKSIYTKIYNIYRKQIEKDER